MKVEQFGVWVHTNATDETTLKEIADAAATRAGVRRWIGEPRYLFTFAGSDPFVQYNTAGVKGIADVSLWTWVQIKWRRLMLFTQCARFGVL